MNVTKFTFAVFAVLLLFVFAFDYGRLQSQVRENELRIKVQKESIGYWHEEYMAIFQRLELDVYQLRKQLKNQ